MKKILKRIQVVGVITIAISITFACSKNKTHTEDIIKLAEKLYALEFTNSEIDSLINDLETAKEDYKLIRSQEINNSVSPKILFNPQPVGFEFCHGQEEINWDIPKDIELPENDYEIAFLPVSHLASLIQNKKITSLELTKIYIDRLKKYGDTLECVVTITEELALEQAKKADKEISEGIYHGPLHGIPFGVKDLFAVKGYKTTWGAMPYKDQLIDETATIVNRLTDAGAVLVSKLTLGALAMGDVWYDGVTKNPWDLNQGSSGSSAGSASATAAGLVGFSIGTETWGSIVSPSTRCGVSGLRPTFGRVSRSGAMALSWTMDKVGPICRTAEDCALVFDAIRGYDPLDETTICAAFNYKTDTDLSKLKIAYLKDLFDGEDYRGQENDKASLDKLTELGAKLEAITLPERINVMSLAIILEAEAGAAFDELTRSNKDELLVAQHKYAWPNIFRKARFIPAVEYIQANRLRRELIEEFHQIIKEYDIIVCPSFGGDQLLMTNLTGHPCMCIPNGFDKDGHPTSISFIGNLYDEASIIAIAKKYQDASNFDEKHPEFFMN